ncbi:MAG: shikimate kinase [Clostridia bacterium]|nr:shikimate kinase [Clostridia bacterium]
MIKNNIVLSGFMGSGKTTTGLALAKLLKMEFVDLDIWIEKNQGKSVKDIFADSGEEYFRTLETKAAKLLGAASGKVIACGGGTVLRQENSVALKQNGILFYLWVDAETVKNRLKGDTTRPLLAKDTEKSIISLLEKREPIYRAAADFVIDATVNTQNTINQILNALE